MRLSAILLFICFQSCSQTVATKMEIYDQYRTQQIETRDSLFVLHTVKEWGRLNWWTWGVREDLYHITQNEIEYIFGGTFYNSDKTKILVWVGTKEPNAESIKEKQKPLDLNRICPTGGDTIYSMTALIGFRENLNTIWKLYPFNQKQAVCFDRKEEVINVLGQYYFGQMAEHKMYRMQQNGKRKGHKELEAYGYNLQDKYFWEKCWLWKKDNVGSHGLYPFQIKGYNYKGDKCDTTCAEPYELPKINYPKEILDLYK